MRSAGPPRLPWPPGDWLDDMGALGLVQLTRQHRTSRERPGAGAVRILDRFAHTASVKLGADEYLHLARWNGQWVIVNSLWGLQPLAPTASPVSPIRSLDERDEMAIRSTALDYVESCYDGDGVRMERSLHPDLAKRIVLPNATPSGDRLDQLSALGLVQLVRTWPRSEQRRAEVTILDRAENAASVRIDATTWIDHLHIARWNGRWVIVNVLWAVRPEAATA
jgi:hypothetical protein